jgi:hypothetical protein
LGAGIERRSDWDFALDGAATFCGGSGRYSQADGHSVQPSGQRGAGANRPGLASEHQEGRLKNVGRGVAVAQLSTTDRLHKAAVPPHQESKGSLVAVQGESIQQLGVRGLGFL